MFSFPEFEQHNITLFIMILFDMETILLQYSNKENSFAKKVHVDVSFSNGLNDS